MGGSGVGVAIGDSAIETALGRVAVGIRVILSPGGVHIFKLS